MYYLDLEKKVKESTEFSENEKAILKEAIRIISPLDVEESIERIHNCMYYLSYFFSINDEDYPAEVLANPLWSLQIYYEGLRKIQKLEAEERAKVA